MRENEEDPLQAGPLAIHEATMNRNASDFLRGVTRAREKIN